MTWAFGHFFRSDLATWHLAARAGENLAEIATEVSTSALKCSEWKWVRAR